MTPGVVVHSLVRSYAAIRCCFCCCTRNWVKIVMITQILTHTYRYAGIPLSSRSFARHACYAVTIYRVEHRALRRRGVFLLCKVCVCPFATYFAPEYLRAIPAQLHCAQPESVPERCQSAKYPAVDKLARVGAIHVGGLSSLVACAAKGRKFQHRSTQK